MWKKFVDWIKTGKVEPTNKIPFQRRGENFKGFRITFPWWGNK